MARGKDDWENELWSYLSEHGDSKCPLSDSCEIKKEPKGCIYDKANRADRNRLHEFIDKDNIDFGNISLPKVLKCVQSSILYGHVSKLAKKYRRKWDNNLPVPTNLILEAPDKLPIETRRIPMKACHGATWKLDDCWLIYLNSGDTSARQRFTLYHEIFHILARCKSSLAFKKRRTREPVVDEFLADHFSGNVLVPSELLLTKWAECKDINKLAQVFDVPGTVLYATLRIIELI